MHSELKPQRPRRPPQSALLRPRPMLLVMSLVLLSGCATVGNCDSIPLKEYPKEYSLALADELAAAPASARWSHFVVDSIALRDAVRACKGGR